MTEKKERKVFFRELGRYSALGLELALSVLIGVAIGYYLDKWLGTAPWLMVVWTGFGFAAGVRSLYRAALRSEKDLEDSEKDEEGPP